ncbi:UNVERIFIED_CONTAM: hypothetical protein FKN15_022667 [Acipenser sinensis]
MQPPQSYSIEGQCSSGQLIGMLAGALPDHRGRWCTPVLEQLIPEERQAVFLARLKVGTVFLSAEYPAPDPGLLSARPVIKVKYQIQWSEALEAGLRPNAAYTMSDGALQNPTLLTP